MRRIACIVSGSSRGSNFEAIVVACGEARLNAEVVVLLGTKQNCGAFQRAAALDIPTEILNTTGDLDAQMLEICRRYEVDIVCLTGYLRKIGPQVLQEYQGRILNIHPALLPNFGGQGMYGIRVHQAVLEANEKESGCTVHLVDAEYDHGEIVAQRRIPVLPSDAPESLAARVLEQEHLAYPEAIAKLLATLG